MSARHALLGLLLDRAGYPYQLADRLQRRLGPVWEVNSGHLYQTVKALEREGLIERVSSAAGDHADRHVFAITEEGALEFERWFEETPDTVRLPRRPLLVKITFAGPRRLKDTLAKIDAYERECAQRLAERAHLREELPVEGPLLRIDHMLLRLNLSTDIFQLEGELRWAKQAREILTWLEDSGTPWPPDTGEHRTKCGGARRELFTRIAASAAPPRSSPTSAPSPGEDAPGG
jgi:DNA-binding PadR family transcriptional regulator